VKIVKKRMILGRVKLSAHVKRKTAFLLRFETVQMRLCVKNDTKIRKTLSCRLTLRVAYTLLRIYTVLHWLKCKHMVPVKHKSVVL